MGGPPTAPAPLKAAFLVYSLELGGMERVTTTLVNHLDRRRFDPHLITIDGRGPLRDLLHPHVHHHDLGLTRRTEYLMPLGRLLKQLDPHVLLATGGLHLEMLTLRTLMGGRWGLVFRPVNAPAFFSPRSRWGYRTAYRRADAVVCQGEENKTAWVARAGQDPARVHAIPNPVDLHHVRDLAAAPTATPPPGRPLIVCLGSVQHRKGQDLLARALGQLHARGVPAHVVLVGGEKEPGFLEHLRTLAHEAGVADHWHHVGEQANPYPWLAAADVVALPSRLEGFPNVLVEAMALCKPVVAAACPTGPKDIVTPQTGLLVPPEDPQALAAALHQVLTQPQAFDPRTIRGRAGAFDAGIVTARYAEVLHQACPRAGEPRR